MQVTYEIPEDVKETILKALAEHRFVKTDVIMKHTGLRKRHLIAALEGQPSIEYLIEQDGFRYTGDDEPISEEEIIEMIGADE